MSTEGARESLGGLAYDVILKPASGQEPRPPSPPKEKILTHEEIAQKLKLAEERRQSMEAEKLSSVAKDRVRAQEAQAKIQELNDSFSKTAQEKLRRSMEVNKENREAQIKALQERLRDHLSKVDEVCKSSDTMARELEEKIVQKLTVSEEKRKAQLQAMVDRLKQHGKHIEEVCKSGENVDKACQEKIILKMENALKNREEKLQALQDRLKEHERKIDEVRKNKMNNSSSGESLSSN